MAHLPNNLALTPPPRKRTALRRAAFLLALMPAFAVQAADEALDSFSDAQLTDLAADWQQLDASARAELIAETRDRMQPSTAATLSATLSSTLTSTSTATVSENGPTTRDPRADRQQQNQRSPQKLSRQQVLRLTQRPVQRAPAQPRTQQQVQQPAQITLRAQRRRYGRVVRKADGSLVRIETQVVTVQRRDPQRAFGVGFERRHSTPNPRQPSGMTSVSTGPRPVPVPDSSKSPVSSPAPRPADASASAAAQEAPIGQVRLPVAVTVTKTLD